MLDFTMDLHDPRAAGASNQDRDALAFLTSQGLRTYNGDCGAPPLIR